jgi:ribosomal protein L3
MNIQGKLVVKGEIQQVSDKFSKREFVIEMGDTYPQFISIQLTQDKVTLLDHFKEGEMIDVAINLKGRKWASPTGEVKYFNSIEAWRITGVNNVVDNSSDPLPF